MRADQRLRVLLTQNLTKARLFLLLSALVVVATGLADRGYRGSIAGGCSQALSPFLVQAKSAAPRAITFCNEQNADVADLIVEPIKPGTESLTIDVAGYGDTPGISAELVGADGTRHAVALPRAGDQWMRWTIEVPAPLRSQASTLVLHDRSQEGFGWIGVGVSSPYGGWIPVSIALLLLSALLPWIWRTEPSSPAAALPPAPGRRRQVLLACVVSLITAVALFLRRPSQWTDPYVWVEDGRDVLPAFLKYGWSTMFEPVAGYVLIPNKLIGAIATTASFRWLPEISMVLCVLFTIVVTIYIAVAPTRLRAPVLCAIAVLAVPTDPEVFTTSAYALWWGSLLAVVPVFWDERRAPSLRLRLPFVVAGALSSPFIVFLAPLYLARALWLRQRPEWIMAIVAGAFAATQAALVLLATQPGNPHPLPAPTAVLAKFVGNYFWWSPDTAAPAFAAGLGAAVLIIAAVYALAQRRRNGPVIILVAGCLLLSIVASAGRVPVETLDPFSGGPRYFFYPYIFISWLLIQLMVEARGFARLPLVALLLAPIPHTLQSGQRTHEHLDWRAEVRRCTNETSELGIPVHMAGYLNFVWHSPLSAEDCRQLVRKSLFDDELTDDDLPADPNNTQTKAVLPQ